MFNRYIEPNVQTCKFITNIKSVLYNHHVQENKLQTENTYKHSTSPKRLVPKGKLYIIECVDSAERKVIHQHFEIYLPKLRKTSLYIPYFNARLRFILKRCYECNKYIPLYYHEDPISHNLYEYYSGFCDKCERSTSYEPNFSSLNERKKIKRIYYNNTVVLGDYLQFSRPSHATPLNISLETHIKTSMDKSQDEFYKILSNCNIYEINSPRLGKSHNKIYLNKYMLRKFIDREIKCIDIREYIAYNLQNIRLTQPPHQNIYEKYITEIILDYYI